MIALTRLLRYVNSSDVNCGTNCCSFVKLYSVSQKPGKNYSRDKLIKRVRDDFELFAFLSAMS